MAFRHIPGNSQYQYDQSPPDPGVGHPQRALWQKSENGIRTEHGQSNYVRCRRIGSGDVDHGEISKSYWDLRSSVSSYGVLALEPKLILDFKESVFDTNGTASTFDASITHSASSNATMTDSDGLLKWRPHNVMTYSQDFTHSNWVTNLDVFANVTAAPDGTLTADKLIEASGEKRGRVQQNVAAAGRTLAVYAKAAEWDHVALAITNGSGYWSTVTFNLTSGTLAGVTQYGSNGLVDNPTITSVGDGWYLCTVDIATQTGSSPWAAIMPFNQSGDPVNPSPALVGDGTSGIYVWGAHTFRSDLGGMVNNPDTTSSYVPTTTSAVYSPRRGHHIYNGSTWVNEGILHESEARSNILTYSNGFTNGIWTKQSAGVTANSEVSPSGLTDALLITAQANTLQHRIYQNRYNVGTHNTSYTKSIYAKAGTANYVSVGGGTVTVGYAVFDLSRGEIISQANIQQANIEDVGGGWYRCSIHGTVTSTFLVVNMGTTAAQAVPQVNWLGAGQTVYLYGAQWEAGSTPSSYIPTLEASITRAAETLTVPAANLPYDSTNMSIQIDGKMTYADTGADNGKLIRWEKDVANKLWVALDSAGSSTGSLYWVQRSLGVSDFTSSLPQFSPGTNVPFNLSSRHGSTFLNAAVGGTAGIADTTPTSFPDLSATNLSLGHNLMGTIGQFRMWSDDLGDVGITEATLPSTEPSLSLTFDGSETSFTVLDWSE